MTSGYSKSKLTLELQLGVGPPWNMYMAILPPLSPLRQILNAALTGLYKQPSMEHTVGRVVAQAHAVRSEHACEGWYRRS